MPSLSVKLPIEPTTEFDLFEHAPVSLWQSDYSALKAYFQFAWAKDVEDMEQFLLQHPKHFECCMQKIKVLNLNQATLRLFKADSKHQLILGLEQVYTEEGVAAYAKTLADIYQGETEGSCYSQMRDFEGLVRKIKIHWSVMPGYQQCFSRVVIAITLVNEGDLQPGIKNREVIKRLPNRFQKLALQRAFDIIENMPDLVAHGDFATNRITYMNAAGRKMLGIDPDVDLSSFNIAQFHTPEFFERVEKEIVPLLKARKIWTGQTEMIALSGEVIPLIQVIVPHIDSCGALHGTSTITKDMRAIKKAEAEILEQQQELANLYRINAMSEVASSIAHEINQPLTALKNYANGCLHRMKTQPVSPGIEKGIRGVVEQARRAGEIVHHIKNYLKRGELHYAKIDVNHLVMESLKYSMIIPKDHIEIETQFAKRLPAIQGDKLYLQQMLINLIGNAVQALQNISQHPLVIGLRTEKNDDDTISITVSDNGVGMSADVQEKIFTPLYTQAVGGTGIGLAFVRYIIEQHGGSIAVFSKPNEGSQFVVTLPINAPAESLSA